MLTQTDTFTDLPPPRKNRSLTFAMAGVGAKLQSASVNGIAAQVIRETQKEDGVWLHLVRVMLPTGKNAVVESRWMTVVDDGVAPAVAVTIVNYDTEATQH